MELNFRQTLIKIVTFLGGLYFFLEFMLPEKFFGIELGSYNEPISNGLVTVGSMAVGLGLINLIWTHGSRIIFNRKGAGPGLALLISMTLMLYITASEWIATNRINSQVDEISNLADFGALIKTDHEKQTVGVKPLNERIQFLIAAVKIDLSKTHKETLDVEPQSSWSERDRKTVVKANDALVKNHSELEAALNTLESHVNANVAVETLLALDATTVLLKQNASLRRDILMTAFTYSSTKAGYELLYNGFFIPLGSAMFSLLAFYIVSAGYRAFRVRSLESSLMMAAALIVMLGQIPFGLWIYKDLPEIRSWLLQVPNAAAFRAIKFGAALALLVMAFRMWFSIETRSFSNDKKEGEA